MSLLCFLVTTNPNDATGGGGSLAGEMHDADAKGPYFVWPAQEFESVASPHAVVAASEVRHMMKMLEDVEPIAGGEDTSRAAFDAVMAGPPALDFGKDDAPDPEVFDLEDPDDFRRAFGGE